MPLSTCPDCGGKLSTAATACPHCGAPTQPTRVDGPKVTTQATSKNLKAQGCLASVLTVAGASGLVVGLFNHLPGLAVVGGILLAIGLPWSLVVRFRRWWHHG